PRPRRSPLGRSPPGACERNDTEMLACPRADFRHLTGITCRDAATESLLMLLLLGLCHFDNIRVFAHARIGDCRVVQRCLLRVTELGELNLDRVGVLTVEPSRSLLGLLIGHLRLDPASEVASAPAWLECLLRGVLDHLCDLTLSLIVERVYQLALAGCIDL